MNPLLEDDDDLLGRREREVTLSTGSILGIFFGLVLICGIFFGFGYNLGRKSAPLAVPATTQAAEPATDFNDFKPAAGLAPGAATTPSSTAPSSAATPAPAGGASAQPLSSAATGAAPTAAPPGGDLGPPAPATEAPSSAAAISSAPVPQGSFIVQIAAVSHPEDATLLLNALRARGYDVSTRKGPQDGLIHIQVGPFTNHADAEAMRQRLLADGYNAILK